MFRTKRIRNGFTLIELLVVILILAILAALIVPRLFSHVDDAKRSRALSDVQQLTSDLTRFRMDTGRFPTDEEGLQALMSRPSDVNTWNGPYIEKLPTDPWGSEYVYKDQGGDATPLVESYGADGAEGGDGNAMDITNQDQNAGSQSGQ